MFMIRGIGAALGVAFLLTGCGEDDASGSEGAPEIEQLGAASDSEAEPDVRQLTISGLAIGTPNINEVNCSAVEGWVTLNVKGDLNGERFSFGVGKGPDIDSEPQLLGHLGDNAMTVTDVKIDLTESGVSFPDTHISVVTNIQENTPVGTLIFSGWLACP